MNSYFNWSKVYSVSHAQGTYLIFTIEDTKKKHAGVMIPACLDDIWYVAGSRLMEKIERQELAGTHEEVLDSLNAWMSQNLKGQFAIKEAEGMYPPLELEEDV